MTRRATFHVGTPKSGTSYLQDRLALNRDAVREAGLDYVSTRSGDHFEAALDLMGVAWGGAEKDAVGEWDALVARAVGGGTDVLVSHEILAMADAAAAERAVASFPGTEAHVVLTLRDLGRQVPAEWQENVKHRARRSYASFLTRIQRQYDDPASDRFWRVQHVPHVLDTWSQVVPPERIHVVTVPPPGAPRDLLWRRYTTAIGLAEDAAPTDSRTANASLGSAETALLRRLNAELPPTGLAREPYVQWVREGVVREVLGRTKRSAPISVPPALRGWVDDLARAWDADLRGRGLVVHGDLDDLRPRWETATDDPWPDPDEPDLEAALAAAVDALAWTIRAAAALEVPPPVAAPGEDPAPAPAPWKTRVARALRGRP